MGPERAEATGAKLPWAAQAESLGCGRPRADTASRFHGAIDTRRLGNGVRKSC
jgi:hypothetical protein